MVERLSEEIRDGEQAAAERHQAEIEMEQGLIAQKQFFQRRSGLPIFEQADGSDDMHEDGENSITAGQGFQHEGSGQSIGSPGGGTDPSETQTSSGDLDPEQHAEHEQTQIEFRHGERTFEGDGRHALEDQ
jgi:hypothetical protein